MTQGRARAETMRWAPVRLVIAMALALLCSAWARGAAAEVADSIVFVREHALWRVPAEGNAGAVEVVALGTETVTALVASPVGDAVLVELGERVAWVPLTGMTRALRALDCRPPARFSPDGRYVACAGPSAKAVVYALPGEQRSLLDVPAAQVVGLISGTRLVAADDAGIWAVPTEPRAQRALLAPHRPSGALLVGPHGRRAVGVYPALSNHKSPGLYVFRLDGKGVRRRLLPEATPVAWSRDDRWIAVQGESSACLVRATGGQYKCWKRYQALAMSPDGSHMLMGKPSEKEGRVDLYLGERDGVRPGAPRLLERAITGPAAWMPACATCR
jgi:hypothetical protein